ncbi:peptidoglycan-binding protein [Agrobacterium leguminum]|uniref:glycoside hydrolase family protein n=1 Tax=Agrobacterium leguminum TaxID=2792015 RepID=UPI00272D1580|nr:peptidoglycan-binding protein [Agrobacterium leguminum]WLD95989.1 peptidoglycan-binding protein [Agrobacterium leguminum]
MSVVTTSPRGRAFMDAHEGNPLTCYLDPVRIPTIGRGFTMRSRSVRRELEKIGITKLVPGKTKLTSSQSEAIFAAVLRDEFEPAVVAKSPNARKQHEMDAAVSAIFNLGTGAMDWQWAKFWRAGKQKQAADYLATHYNTAGGKKLPGLVRRRKEEALLFEKGIYTGVGEGVPRSAQETAPKQPDPVVKEAQAILSAKGFNPGAIDGWMGEKTAAAVKAYQSAHPHLVADGIIGPATLSQLRRDAVATKEAMQGGAGSLFGSGFAAWSLGLPWGWIALLTAAVVLGVIAYRKRDVISRRINSLLGREVAV